MRKGEFSKVTGNVSGGLVCVFGISGARVLLTYHQDHENFPEIQCNLYPSPLQLVEVGEEYFI